MSKLDGFIKEQTFICPTALQNLIVELAKVTNRDIKELKILLLSHSGGDFTDLEQLQEEFFISQVKPLKEGKTKSDGKTKPRGSKGLPPPAPQYIPGQRIAHTKESLIIGAILLEKAKQMEKEQLSLIRPESLIDTYDVGYDRGTLNGISRIVRLIERHYKS